MGVRGISRLLGGRSDTIKRTLWNREGSDRTRKESSLDGHLGEDVFLLLTDFTRWWLTSLPITCIQTPFRRSLLSIKWEIVVKEEKETHDETVRTLSLMRCLSRVVQYRRLAQPTASGRMQIIKPPRWWSHVTCIMIWREIRSQSDSSIREEHVDWVDQRHRRQVQIRWYQNRYPCRSWKVLLVSTSRTLRAKAYTSGPTSYKHLESLPSERYHST